MDSGISNWTSGGPAFSAEAAGNAVIGENGYHYEVIDDWAKLPDGWSFNEVASVGVDRSDNVYVFNRGDHPVIVFDRDGNFLRSWGDKTLFPRAHGLSMAPDDTIFLTDQFDHTVRRCTLDGTVLLTLGVPGKPAPFMSGRPFCSCTQAVTGRDGSIFVSDGYGNAAVHKYAPDGRHLLSWGACGVGVGEFNIPHSIACDGDGWVYVVDRENNRIQIFDENGRYETEWRNLHRPTAMMLPTSRCPVCVVSEFGPSMVLNSKYPNLGARLSVLDPAGKVIARVGDPYPGFGPGQFAAPHGIAMDSHGDIYVAEVPKTVWGILWSDVERPAELRCLRKLRRVPSPPGAN